MRRMLLTLSFVALNLVVGAMAAQAKKLDYTEAYDPLTHKPITVCVGCWFWSCGCGTVDDAPSGTDDQPGSGEQFSDS